MAGASVKWRIHRFDEVQMEVMPMLGWKSRSWFYPKPTGDPGRDRNARTVQFACFLLAFAVSAVAILNVISGKPSAETPILVFAVAGLVAAMVTNRAGSWEWAARTAFLAVLLTIHFARLNYEGINEKGWSARTTTELERCFKAGAQGLKIWKDVGLTFKNHDETYIQADDPRFDPIWEMCARYNKPVMIHLSDSYGRFLPIGPENERYEAGLWRNDTEGNYYNNGHVTPDVIERARENMHRKHPNTHFINAHVAMLYHDMDRVTAFLDQYPNANVEISAAVQDLGRAPLLIRKFFLKYQDRILFGSDGNPGRGVEEFWVPHFRFLETYDEHFDHPAQLRSPTGAPLHGRWKIYGIGLPDDVLRKVYYANALRYVPAARATVERRLAAGL
jgi:predicted TIM-barrel fold metal-dependent hydrolase